MRRFQRGTTSLRAQRLQALAPRVLVLGVVAILGLNGLRAIFADPAAPIAPVQPVQASRFDTGVHSFAEAFARAYLTWSADDPEARDTALAAFVGETSAGLRPGEGTSQRVAWATVVATEQRSDHTLVTVAAQTSERLLHLSVPVARNPQGVLRITGYPALVGGPTVDRDTVLAGSGDQAVLDDGLQTVVGRALGNYLAHQDVNLLADLTATATVSLPDARLRLQGIDSVTWVLPDRRVAVELQAVDRTGTAFTLRYEVDVRLSDRWYVHAIHVNSTSGGGN